MVMRCSTGFAVRRIVSTSAMLALGGKLNSAARMLPSKNVSQLKASNAVAFRMTPADLSAAAAASVPPCGTTTALVCASGPGKSHWPRSHNPVPTATPPMATNHMTVQSRPCSSPLRNEGPSSHSSSGSGGGAEDDGGVGAAKSKTIRKGHADLPLLRLIRHPVDHTVAAGFVKVERGRRD